jgi:uncharacterized sodium:solute symporter family permease YidK
MSTISTQLNWGAGYLVNDVYQRFVKPEASDKELIRASRLSTLLLMVLGLLLSSYINSISDTWTFILQAGAGLGLVLILRWYWWRVNVWSEVSATIAPFVATAGFWIYQSTTKTEIDMPTILILTTIFTTIIWLLVTFVTQPEPTATLTTFWERVHGHEDYKNQSVVFRQQGLYLLGCWISALFMTYSLLFMTGKFLLQEYGTGFMLFLLAGGSWVFLQHFMELAGIIGVGEEEEVEELGG